MTKSPPANAGDVGLIPGSGRSPGGGNGSPLQYSCLENSRDRKAWQATVHGDRKESGKTEKLSKYTHTNDGDYTSKQKIPTPRSNRLWSPADLDFNLNVTTS